MSLTSLSDRSFEARMGFAYLVDALYSFDPTVRPSSTLDRVVTNMGDDKHAYTRIWDRIQSIYSNYWFNGVLASELSESELRKAVNAAYIKGAEYENLLATGPEVLAKAQAWGERGWFRYEENRQTKVDKAKKFGWITGLVLSSFII